MSDDLISRKEAVELVISEYDRFQDAGGSHSGRYELDKVIKMLQNMPTAFDKEKVIEELNNLKDDLIDCNDLCGECVEIECDQCALEKAIEIVEKGGIENGKNN